MYPHSLAELVSTLILWPLSEKLQIWARLLTKRKVTWRHRVVVAFGDRKYQCPYQDSWNDFYFKWHGEEPSVKTRVAYWIQWLEQGMHNRRIIFRFLEGSHTFTYSKAKICISQKTAQDIDLRFFNLSKIFGLKLIVKISRHRLSSMSSNADTFCWIERKYIPSTL
jgi:hypothetical protein